MEPRGAARAAQRPHNPSFVDSESGGNRGRAGGIGRREMSSAQDRGVRHLLTLIWPCCAAGRSANTSQLRLRPPRQTAVSGAEDRLERRSYLRRWHCSAMHLSRASSNAAGLHATTMSGLRTSAYPHPRALDDCSPFPLLPCPSFASYHPYFLLLPRLVSLPPFIPLPRPDALSDEGRTTPSLPRSMRGWASTCPSSTGRATR